MIANNHVANLNKNCDCNYHPSDSIFVDEYMSRWYGIGEHRKNSGLPQYIAINRKTQNGCEIYNTADGFSVIIMQLKFVKTSSEEDIYSPEEHDRLLRGTKVIKNSGVL